MNKKRSNSASALRITFISISAVLLTLGAVLARKQFEQKPVGASAALQSAHRHATVSGSSAAPKQTHARKSARVEFSASRQRVGGREIAGFSARQAQGIAMPIQRPTAFVVEGGGVRVATPAPPIMVRTSGLIAVSMYTTWLRARW